MGQKPRSVKPWTNGAASWRRSTQVWSTCVSFGHPLATSCVDFGRVQIRTQVFHCLATQHKLITSRLHKRQIYDFLRLACTCESDLRSPFPYKSWYKSKHDISFPHFVATRCRRKLSRGPCDMSQDSPDLGAHWGIRKMFQYGPFWCEHQGTVGRISASGIVAEMFV